MTIEKYSHLPFPAAKDMAAVFECVQIGKLERDIELTSKLNKNLLSFEG